MNIEVLAIVTPSIHGRLQLTVVFKALEVSRSMILDRTLEKIDPNV